MPAGCDFICNNDKCEQYKSGFVINSPWPLGKIELVINSSAIKKFPELREKLIEQKNDGRKLACIQFPNNEQIAFEGYRVSLWSPKQKCIWQYDIELNGKTFEEAMDEWQLSDEFKKIDSAELIPFNEITKVGIECPFCNNIMKQNRWFSNEK